MDRVIVMLFGAALLALGAGLLFAGSRLAEKAKHPRRLPKSGMWLSLVIVAFAFSQCMFIGLYFIIEG